MEEKSSAAINVLCIGARVLRCGLILGYKKGGRPRVSYDYERLVAIDLATGPSQTAQLEFSLVKEIAGGSSPMPKTCKYIFI